MLSKTEDDGCEDDGCYVMAWVWVDNENICPECGKANNDGEGYDGLCGSCADKTEKDEDTADPIPAPGDVASKNDEGSIIVTADKHFWQLYCEEAEADAAAKDLSEKLSVLLTDADKLIKQGAVSKESTAIGIRNTMYKIMDRYTHLGARDTEPECILCGLIEKGLGMEEYSLERW